MATSNSKGDCDASPKGGLPGFVKILNDKQLFIPDVAGNKLFHGYGNVESNAKVGLVFFIPGHNNTVRINGRVKVIDRDELKMCGWRSAILTRRRKFFRACCSTSKNPTAIARARLKFSNLWDVDQIAKNTATPPVGAKESGI